MSRTFEDLLNLELKIVFLLRTPSPSKVHFIFYMKNVSAVANHNERVEVYTEIFPVNTAECGVSRRLCEG